MPRKPLQNGKAKATVWLARNPIDDGVLSGWYVVASPNEPSLEFRYTNCHEWITPYATIAPKSFAQRYHGLRLRPGEGPIEVTMSIEKAT